MRSRRHLSLAAAWLTVCLMFTAPGMARAMDSHRVAVVVFLTIGVGNPLTDQLVQELGAAVAAHTGFEVVLWDAARVKLPASGVPDHCLGTPECLRAVGSTIGTDKLLFVVLAGRRQQVKTDLTLVDALRGLPERTFSGTFDTHPEALRRGASQAAAALFPRVQGKLAVTADEGAAISIDGAPAGVAPLPGPLTLDAGEHVVSASKPGFAPAQQRVRVAVGAEAAVVQLTLIRLPPPTPPPAAPQAVAAPIAPPSPLPPPRRSTPVYKRWWFWTAIGAAVVGAGVATAVTLRPGSPSPTPELGVWKPASSP